ncbi:hypothetical protein PspLS_05506 [Pyricularia sp. CBS 133598]|nr:hypothetical protein PspLS_05506 [Pyricularia sp. CBS 133598]
MAPKSLVELAVKAAVRNISLITSVGYAPYELVRPILLKVESAEQLLQIEENCPHIAEESAELWKRLIHKDFARDSEKKRYVPKNPLSWGKVYLKYRRERDEAVAAAEARLNEQFDKLKQERQKNEAQLVKPSQIPFNLRRTTTIGGNSRFGPPGVPRASSNLSWGGGTRTNVNEAGGHMRKVKRQAAEAAKRRAISGQVGALRGQVMRAPKALLDAKRIAQNPGTKAHDPAREESVLPPSRRGDMEARLLKLKQSSKDRGPAVEVSDDELEASDEESSRPSKYRRVAEAPEKLTASFLDDDDEDGEGGDLFGDEESNSRPSYSSSRGSARQPQSSSYQSPSKSASRYPDPASPPPAAASGSSSSFLARKRKTQANVFMQKRR